MASWQRVFFCGLLGFFPSAPAMGQPTHYSVKLVPDFERHILRGEEKIEFAHAGNLDMGLVGWMKQAGLQILFTEASDGAVSAKETTVEGLFPSGGPHWVKFQYTAAEGKGIRWFAGGAGIAAAFFCEAWMVCDSTPGQRATLHLEIVIPGPERDAGSLRSELRAIAAGHLVKGWSDREGRHFVYEQVEPVQTYLFSFGVAQLKTATEAKFSVCAKTIDPAHSVFAKTADAYAFLRGKAMVDPLDAGYTQAFLPVGSRDFGQEAAGLALMSDDYFHELAEKDDVYLMAHEMAHQWWGVLVGIRSWSDFWLNEGFAEFMADAYIEKHQGRAAYEKQMEELRERMKVLREKRKDRPLHWEKWKDAHEALGEIPYVKGALFLDRLRTELGEGNFWRGVALYTSRNARRLVDSGDFQRAMDEASGRDLKKFFDEAVYQ